MQARGRRGDRARMRRVDRLVALGVPGVRRVADVGRQRHAAAAFEHRGDRLGEAHAHQVLLAAEDLDGDAVADDEAMARLEPVP